MPWHWCYGKLGACSVLTVRLAVSVRPGDKRVTAQESFPAICFDVASTKKKSDLRRRVTRFCQRETKNIFWTYEFGILVFCFSAASPAHQETPSVCSCAVLENIWSGKSMRRRAGNRRKENGDRKKQNPGRSLHNKVLHFPKGLFMSYLNNKMQSSDDINRKCQLVS